jgi:hypothetical protein
VDPPDLFKEPKAGLKAPDIKTRCCRRSEPLAPKTYTFSYTFGLCQKNSIVESVTYIRRVGLKMRYREVCRFESDRGHHSLMGKGFPYGCAVVAREKKRSVRKNGACR